jgi:YhcH/YjgK/YiaL family protein
VIYDQLSHVQRYKGMFPALDTALDFLDAADLNALPLGRTEVDGDRVFVNVMEAVTKPSEEGVFEWHEDYLDIQIDLEGQEAVETAFAAGEIVRPYEPDCGQCKGAPTASVTLGGGTFTICMARELHKPGVAVNGVPAAIKKCVVKVKAPR